MRQHHAAGDKGLVDYQKKLGIVDPATGEVRDAEIFVAVLGASSPLRRANWIAQTLPNGRATCACSGSFGRGAAPGRA